MVLKVCFSNCNFLESHISSQGRSDVASSYSPGNWQISVSSWREQKQRCLRLSRRHGSWWSWLGCTIDDESASCWDLCWFHRDLWCVGNLGEYWVNLRPMFVGEISKFLVIRIYTVRVWWLKHMILPMFLGESCWWKPFLEAKSCKNHHVRWWILTCLVIKNMLKPPLLRVETSILQVASLWGYVVSWGNRFVSWGNQWSPVFRP